MQKETAQFMLPSVTAIGDAYRSAQAELGEQLAGLTAALELAEREARAVAANPRRAARALLASWETTRTHVRRTALAELLDRVEVTTGRPRARFVVWSTWGESWSPPEAGT